MYELKNSIKNVKRNIKRYIIVGILIFIISLISVIALIVSQSSKSTNEYYLNEYGKIATIDIDPEEMSKNFSSEPSDDSKNHDPTDIETIDYDTYVAYGDSQYVDSISFQQVVQVFNEDLITSDESDDEDSQNNGGGPQLEFQGSDQMGGFSLIGSDSLETSSYFEDDANILVDGEMPTADNQVIISSDLANYNSLQVGDTIEFGDSEGESMVSLTISGLYQAASSEQMMFGVQNNIFTNYNTVESFTDEHSNITATYTLTSYDVVDQFEQELYDKGLDEMYYVNNNQTLLNQIIGPVESTMSILNNVLIVVFIIGSAILIFVNLLILRERKYEIGVLRALGMKSRKVTSGLLHEMIIVTIVAMILATSVGVVFAQPISDALISSNSQSSLTGPSEMQKGNDHGGFGMNQPQTTNSETVTSIDAKLNGQVLVFTLGINLILILITTFVASRFINRQQPNEILREQ